MACLLPNTQKGFLSLHEGNAYARACPRFSLRLPSPSSHTVWEHAYYLNYQNMRATYVTDFMEKLVNWDFVSKNFEKGAVWME